VDDGWIGSFDVGLVSALGLVQKWEHNMLSTKVAIRALKVFTFSSAIAIVAIVISRSHDVGKTVDEGPLKGPYLILLGILLLSVLGGAFFLT